MLWQNRDLEVNPSVDTSGADLPTTRGELFSAAWSRNQLLQENYFGETDRFNALSDYQNSIKQKTGVDIAAGLDYGTGTTGVTPAAQELLRQTNQKVAELKAKDPTLDIEQMAPDELEQNAVAKRRQADADFHALVSRPRAPGATAGLYAGQAAAGFADPVNIAALPLAPAEGLGLLANALRWGLIGAGAAAAGEALQTPYQEEVQPGRIISGEPALNIAQAFGTTALTGGIFRGIADVWDRVATGAWPQSVRHTGNAISGQANVLASNVYPGADGAAAHEQALPKAVGDILAGQPVDVSRQITPELEARAGGAPIEAIPQAQAAAQAAAQLRAVAPEPTPELPFARTAAEAEADRFRQQATVGVQTMARNAGYEMPAEEAGRVADKLIAASPDEVQDLLRNLHMSPRQVAEAPAREERAAEEITTPVSPVDMTSPDFEAATRADLDRELVQTVADYRAAGWSPEQAEALAAEHMRPYDFISEAGIPSRAISSAETGLPAPGISSSGKTLPLPSTQPEPLTQISKRTAPEGSLIARTTSPPETLVGPTNILGSIEQASNRKILHGSNDLNTLVAAAERNKPLVDARLKELVAEVPGTEYHGSRVKDVKQLNEKLAAGKTPQVISDYLGARIIADMPEALENISRRIIDSGSVIDLDDFLDPGKEGYRAVHLQLNLGDGTSAELQLVPRPIAEVQSEAHDLRQPVKRMDPTDPLQGPLYREQMQKVRAVLDNAWTTSTEWKALRPGLAEIDARELPATLPEKHASYFKIDQITSTIPIGRLISSKTEADNAKGAPNAAKRMAASAGGEIERRRPINVHTLPNGMFLIKDGNASYTAAKQYGWLQMPVHIDDEPGLLPREHSLPNGVAMFNPDELGVDAERFQFKAGTDEAGVSERLRGVKDWDPIKAGMVLTWTDKDGKAWIVDGHQRVALAKRIAAEDPSQHPQLLARTLKESDGISAEHARAVAAMKNIAEGTGTAVDAAKVIRDHPELAGDLPPRSELVRQARGLVNLSPDAFRLVVNDVVPANYGAIVGRLVPADPEMQTALLHLLAKTDPANAVQAEAIARQGIEAGLAKQEAGAQASLFGEQEVAQSLYVERAKVLDRALKTLRRDKTVFGTLVKEQETLAQAGNVLAHEINQQRMTADGQALQILQTLANRSGPISDALRTAAARAKSDGYAAATREFVQTVREAASSGDLARLADGIERSPSHVGDEGTAATIDHGIATEPVDAERAERAEQQIEKTLAPAVRSKAELFAMREPTAAEANIARLKDEAAAASKQLFALHQREASAAEIAKAEATRDRAEAALNAAEGLTREGLFEPGAEGLPQGIMPGMEPSARQLAAARAGPLRPGIAQQAPGGLFARPAEQMPDMFPAGIDANGKVQYRGIEDALNEVDAYKAAAEQLATCGAPAPTAEAA